MDEYSRSVSHFSQEMWHPWVSPADMPVRRATSGLRARSNFLSSQIQSILDVAKLFFGGQSFGNSELIGQIFTVWDFQRDILMRKQTGKTEIVLPTFNQLEQNWQFLLAYLGCFPQFLSTFADLVWILLGIPKWRRRREISFVCTTPKFATTAEQNIDRAENGRSLFSLVAKNPKGKQNKKEVDGNSVIFQVIFTYSETACLETCCSFKSSCYNKVSSQIKTWRGLQRVLIHLGLLCLQSSFRRRFLHFRSYNTLCVFLLDWLRSLLDDLWCLTRGGGEIEQQGLLIQSCGQENREKLKTKNRVEKAGEQSPFSWLSSMKVDLLLLPLPFRAENFVFSGNFILESNFESFDRLIQP